MKNETQASLNFDNIMTDAPQQPINEDMPTLTAENINPPINNRGYNYFGMKKGEEINQALTELPTATEQEIYTATGKINRYKAIEVTAKDGSTQIVQIPHKGYATIQHRQAFRPIIEGMTQAGIKDFFFIMSSNHKKAEMQIYATGTGYDSVSLGFSVINSFDGSKALSYGFRIFGEHKTIELVGYRQVCSNGMKIRVPLENAEIVRPEIKSKVMELVSKYAKILHTRGAFEKIETMQYVTEAISLLREPIELYIKKAQHWKIDDVIKLNLMIKQHVGKRFQSKIKDQMLNEDRNLWGLYNAITYVASHDTRLKQTARESLINKASDMLETELTADIRA